MSTSKTFKFNLFCNGNLEILSCDAIIKSITESDSKTVYSGSFDLVNQEIELAFDVNDGEHFYAVFSVWRYKHDGAITDISPNNNDPANQRNVDFLGVFNANDNTVALNPLSTVASAYTFARAIKLMDGEVISITAGKNFCEVAYGMKNNFYYTAGQISKVISSSPNATETNSLAAFNFLANLVNYTLTNQTVYTNFLSIVNQIDGVNAASLLNALVAVAQHPFDNVQDIYNLVDTMPVIYYPSLQQLSLPEGVSNVPDQWTLAIKINNSGSENFLISGTAFTVFDKDNKAWVTNNFRQGTPNSGTHCIVFNPDGSPADISPIMGGGILGPGFGVAVSPDGGTIAIGNYGWGNKVYNPVKGSISVFSSDGDVLCPPGGFTNKICRVQGMCYDPDGNLWMASWGTQAPMEDPTAPSTYDVPGEFSAVVCYLNGDPNQALVYNDFGSGPSEYHGTFGVVIDKAGNCIVSNAGTAGKVPSSVYKVRISPNKDKLDYVASWESNWVGKNPTQIPDFEEFRQPQVDNEGNIYVGGITSGRVVKLNGETLQLEDEFSYNIYGPWGITIDSKGKKFITGFGEKKTVDVPDKTVEWTGPFAITVVESDDETWSDAKLMTLPTAGEEVRLANGQPLYGHQLDKDGNQIPPSYQPLMRVTSTSIDRAGNLWCANNWKPSLYVDVFTDGVANPGGDGVVIFIGVAEPIV